MEAQVFLLEVPGPFAERLEEQARRLGVSPEERLDSIVADALEGTERPRRD